MEESDMSCRCRLVIKIIVKNWVPLLYFEILYKLSGFIMLFPFLRYLVSLLPGFAGVTYLGQENIGSLFKNPVSVLLFLTILLLSALYITLEITALFILCEKGWQHERISLLQLLRLAVAGTVRLLSTDRIGVFLLLPVLMLSFFSPLSGYLKTIRIPGFIWDAIVGSRTLLLVYICVMLLFHMLLLLFLFGLPAMLFSGKSFIKAWRESLGLIHGRKLKTAAIVLSMTGLFLAAYITLVSLLALLMGIWTKVSASAGAGRYMLETNLHKYAGMVTVAGSALTASFLYGCIIVLYHSYRGEQWEEAKRVKTGIRRTVFQAVCGLIWVAALLILGETEMGGDVFMPMDTAPVLVAHRAGALLAPENTLAALSRAIEDRADVVEIDVQQLGDGTLIVMHDTNFKRTTGRNLDVWDADYEEVRGLNAGSYYTKEHMEEPVPTLEEFLIQAGNRIQLMIELKANPYSAGIEERVLSLISRYHMQKQCMIASMDLDILKRVKELDPEMETIYITAILIAGQFDLANVDGYSVETTSLSIGMALQAHFQDKKIYGWTANSEYAIKKLISSGVDGIITDHPRYAEDIISQYGTNLWVEGFVKLFYGEENAKG